MSKKRTIVCRCEDLTLEDVENAIDEGYTDIEELRKKLQDWYGSLPGKSLYSTCSEDS